MSDISLCYTKQGGGPPLILLHGNGQDGNYFTHQMEYFSPRYTVYAVDTRGHGRSPRGEAPFTITQFAQDLSDFMNEHDILRAPILGFSDGGNIALTFALAHPGRVIVLGYKFASLFAGKSEKARAHAEMLGLMVNEPHIDPQALQSLRTRTLVIVGTKDMIKDEHTLLIAHSLPRGRLEVIAVDHFIAAKNPRAFNEAVDQFLSEGRDLLL